MSTQNPQLEELHQQAAAHYLQGEFQQALQIWRQLLVANADDERAQEGARLCELLTKGEGAVLGAATAAPEPSPVAVSNPPTEFFDEDELSDLETLMDGEGDDAWAPTTPETPAAAIVAPEALQAIDQPEGDAAPEVQWDLGNLDGADSAPSDGETLSPATDRSDVDIPAMNGPADSGSEFAFDGVGADDPVDADASATGLAAGSTASASAAAELRHRTGELLTQAEKAYATGDRDQALRTISRIFILDEENEPAFELQQRILTDGEPEGPAMPAVEADGTAGEELTTESLESLPLDLDGFDTGGDKKNVGAGGLDAEPLVDLHIPAVQATEPAETESAAAPAKAKRPARAVRGGSLRLVAIASVTALLLGAGGYFGWQYFLVDDTPAADRDVDAQPTRPTPAPAQPAPTATTAAPPTNATPADAGSGPVDLETLLAKGRESLEAGDYGQAVLDYQAALRVDPSSAEARAGVILAGEHYQAHVTVLKQNEEALAAFNRGDYRSALTLFYRLPEAVDDPRYDRYKANGWYNLGVQALKSGDCSRALSNFREARQISTDDAGVKQGIRLGKACRELKKEPAYFQQVYSLSLRGLQD